MKKQLYFNDCQNGNAVALKQTRMLFGCGFLLCLFFSQFYCADTSSPLEQHLDVTITGSDTVVAIHDSLLIRVSTKAANPGAIRYVWFVDSPHAADTTSDSLLVKWFSIDDTGSHVVVIKAVDARGNVSAPESLSVRVDYHRPVVQVTGDTLTYVNTPYSFHIASTVVETRVARYEWYIDGPEKTMVTTDTSQSISWTVADTGRHYIVVRAIDNDGIASVPDTLAVMVGCHRPIVLVSGDALADLTMPYTFHITSAGGAAVRFEWYLDDAKKTIVTTDSVQTVSWTAADTGRHYIVAEAVDDLGITSLPDSLSVTVGYQLPQLRPFADTSVKVNTTLVIRPSALGPVSRIVSYRYFVDSSSRTVVTFDSTITLPWIVADSGAHHVVVRAESADGIESPPETLSVMVTCRHPQVSLSAAASVPVNDTTSFIAHAADSDGTIKYYRWSIDNGWWFATDTSLLRWAFANTPGVKGGHSVRVVAVDNDGLFSDTARALIAVTLHRPTVSILGSHDTTIYAGIALKIRATAFDSNGVVVSYRWTNDGRPLGQFAKSDSASVTWIVENAGVHLMTLTVVDDDSLESSPDTLRVRVLSGTPSVTAMRDTTVLSKDTLRISCAASDPNGSIVRYLWNYSGNGWDDSTTTTYYRLAYAGKGIVRVIVGARDNDGLIAIDTVLVTFNRPPDAIVMLLPGPNDTLVFAQKAGGCTVSFAYNATDPDNDSVTYTLSWGPSSPDSLSAIYQGKDRTTSVNVVNPGQYFWRLVATDPRGQASTMAGKVVVLKEFRICFVGHSVITGWGGDNIQGGFRGGVIDSLRKKLGAYERLKVTGPFATTSMGRSIVDDSCMAVVGTTAREIYLMFGLAQIRLWADIWVLMIGVNDNYSYNEYGYAVKIMDTMISRNPQSRLYVLNGYALPSASYLANYYLPYFNQALLDSSATRNAKGAHISVVDAFGALSTSTGQYDSTWYVDGLHPNQAGYNRLRDRIYSTMKSSIPPALSVNP